MGSYRGRGTAVAALCVALVVAAPCVRAAVREDPPSAVTLPSGELSTEAISIRKVLETYVRAVEAKDMQMFNGSIVSSFPQTFSLAKETAGWMIQDIGR